MELKQKRAETKLKIRSRDIFDFISLRHATPREDSEVGSLLVRSFSETYAEKLPDYKATIERMTELRDVESRRKHGTVLLLELGYRIIGSASLIRPEAEKSQCWIRNSANLRCVAVDPDFQGLGFSDLLLSESEKLARSWNAKFICLHVQKGAEGVARLYQKRGYIREPLGDVTAYGHLIEAYFLPLNEIASIRIDS